MKRPITYILMIVAIWALGPLAPLSSPAEAAINGWRAEYYTNRWLSGQPALVRTDGGIAFNWGGGSPAAALPADRFSARWTRDLNFEEATYRFSARTDDGVRVYIDGSLVLDQFIIQAPTTHSVTRPMSAGQHQVVVEYFENTGEAVAQFWWNKESASGGPWRGEYFDNRWLGGNPVLTRSESGIDFNWGAGAPDAMLPADGFSARWTRSAYFEAGAYRFTTETDDGVRLFVDGNLVIDRWVDQSLSAYSVKLTLTEGHHIVRMEYYEHQGGAAAHLHWERDDTPAPGGRWRGEYFTNRHLAGTPALVREDAEIAFDWGTASPDFRLPADNFSVRWTRDVTVKEGNYVFETSTDDGVRLYIDGRVLIDEWRDMSLHTFQARTELTGGTHTLRMEYYEHIGSAQAKLRWYPADDITPAGNLITCVGTRDSWIKVYQLTANGEWLDMNQDGWGAIDVTGYLKIDGLAVDLNRYGRKGHPYRVELWSQGRLVRSVGNIDTGQPMFRIRPEADNYTPWQCPAL